MRADDTIEFEAVNLDQLVARNPGINHMPPPPPARVVFPNGPTFEVVNEGTGTYRLLGADGKPEGYVRAESVSYMPTTGEQFLASRDTVPRLPQLQVRE